MKEDANTMAARAFVTLQQMILAQMPQPKAPHIYSIANRRGPHMVTRTSASRDVKKIPVDNGVKIDTRWILTIGYGLEYSAYAMGYKADGSKRTARGPLEALNFQTVDNCMKHTARLVAVPNFGKVVIK